MKRLVLYSFHRSATFRYIQPLTAVLSHAPHEPSPTLILFTPQPSGTLFTQPRFRDIAAGKVKEKITLMISTGQVRRMSLMDIIL